MMGNPHGPIPMPTAWTNALDKLDGKIGDLTTQAKNKLSAKATTGGQNAKPTDSESNGQTPVTIQPIQSQPAKERVASQPTSISSRAMKEFQDDEAENAPIQQLPPQPPVVDTSRVAVKPQPVVSTQPVPVNQQRTIVSSTPLQARQPVQTVSQPQVQVQKVYQKVVVHQGGNQGKKMGPLTISPSLQRSWKKILSPNQTKVNCVLWDTSDGFDLVRTSPNDSVYGYYARLNIGSAGQVMSYMECLNGVNFRVQLGQGKNGASEVLIGQKVISGKDIKYVPFGRPEEAISMGKKVIAYAEFVWGQKWEVWEQAGQYGLYIVGGAPHWRAMVTGRYFLDEVLTSDGRKAYLVTMAANVLFANPNHVKNLINDIKALGPKMANDIRAPKP